MFDANFRHCSFGYSMIMFDPYILFYFLLYDCLTKFVSGFFFKLFLDRDQTVSAIQLKHFLQIKTKNKREQITNFMVRMTWTHLVGDLTQCHKYWIIATLLSYNLCKSGPSSKSKSSSMWPCFFRLNKNRSRLNWSIAPGLRNVLLQDYQWICLFVSAFQTFSLLVLILLLCAPLCKYLTVLGFFCSCTLLSKSLTVFVFL